MTVDPPFTEISLLNQVMPGHYLRPRRKNYPTVDSLVVLDKSIFHPGGLALVLLQFTGSQTHEADGSVAKRVHDEVVAKLTPVQQPPAPPSSSRSYSLRTKNPPRAATPLDLPIILVFGTTPEGINKAQTVTNHEGKSYQVGEPKIAQYSMILGTEFDEIIKAWPVEN